MRTRVAWALALPVVLFGACAEQQVPTAASSSSEAGGPRLSIGGAEACGVRINNTIDKLLECVTIDGVRAHQAALQAIADANNGTRVSGTTGYDQSLEYVVDKLEGAGYQVSVQPFQYETFLLLSPSAVQQVAPPPAGGLAHSVFSYSGSGDVTAPVTLLSGADPSPGCDASDYAGFPAGNIALIARGSCTFQVKAQNANSAGAAAVVIYNNAAGAFTGTLSSAFTINMPVVAVSGADGQQLAATPGLVMRVKTETFRGTATSYNVLAEIRTGNANNVIMVGAHLDAVNAGPGINDNGSGVGAVLETALHMARVKTRNNVRFAFWGAEEAGLVGSTYYVNTRSADELNRIALYLNFDVLGSPNHVFFVLDGDDSDGVGAGPAPAGSAEVESMFASFYTMRGLPYKGADPNGTSDYGPFSTAGIAIGGLHSGASGIKTPEEAALWGGVAGVAYDPCYHLACDTYDNVNLFALDTNADAVAYATLSFAMNTELVNGIKGKGNFRVKTTVSPSATQEAER